LQKRAAEQLKAFSQAGGQVLFGTDVGYIDVFGTSQQFKWMARAGMDFKQILASLTTNPAQRFGYATHSGRIANGMNADFVILKCAPRTGRRILQSALHNPKRRSHLHGEVNSVPQPEGKTAILGSVRNGGV